MYFYCDDFFNDITEIFDNEYPDKFDDDSEIFETEEKTLIELVGKEKFYDKITCFMHWLDEPEQNLSSPDGCGWGFLDSLSTEQANKPYHLLEDWIKSLPPLTVSTENKVKDIKKQYEEWLEEQEPLEIAN